MARVSLSRCSSDVRSSAGDTGIVCRAVAAIAGWRVPVAVSDQAALARELAAGLALAGRGWVAVLAPTFAFGWAVAGPEVAPAPWLARAGVAGKLVAGSEAGGPT